MKISMNTNLPRRTFLRRSFAASAGLLLLPSARLALGYPANSKLNVAFIGINGQGGSNLGNISGLGENVVALCDVDHKYAAESFKKFPSARAYKDFRRMFDEMEKGIDAVAVSTPDHTHAVAAISAMRLGKHVYCEKPLTRTVREARAMRETAVKTKVVTQMGNQGSASNGLRRAVEMAWGGVLGEITEAHVWFDGGNGPMKRPTDAPPVPATLDWDLWLGPAAQRPYHPCYLPGSWRAWRAFGSGIVGDFGCHTANIMFRALHLEKLWNFEKGEKPKQTTLRIQATASEVDLEGYPTSMKATVEIPARKNLPPVKLTLYAKERPSADLMLGYPQAGWGDLLVGTKASLYSECPWNTRFSLLPEAKFADFKGGPAESLPRTDSHHREWVNACKGQGKTFSPFTIGGPLTELMQLANLAVLVPGVLEYDTVSGRILNSKPADALLHREYRKGWKI